MQPPVANDDDAGPVGWIREIVLDTAEPWALARFWAGLLGGVPVQWYPGWVTLEPPPHGQRLSFQAVGESFQAVRELKHGQGAGPAGRSGAHFDVVVSDLAAAHDRVIAAGGTFLAEHVSPRRDPDGEVVSWRVYTDPHGHPFCLVVR